jgi:hypothetical protein
VEEHAAGVYGAAAKGHVLGAVEGEIGTRLGLELGLLRLSTLFSTLAIHFPLGLSLGEQQQQEQEKHDWMNGGERKPRRRRRQFSSPIPPIDCRHFLLKKIELAQSVFKRAY